jgi:hypothetical protein
MKNLGGLFAIWLLVAGLCPTRCSAQDSTGNSLVHLHRIIELPHVKGRIDHLDIDLKDRVVYIAALGNNTLEVVDLRMGKTSHSITGLDEPQGVAYVPQYREIFVANGGNGVCYFYNAATFDKVASIHLESDADDVRYDSVEQKLYVGYGSGGIAVIDARTHRQVGDIKLPVHPESFQLDKRLQKLFVNLPDAHMIGVVDLRNLELVGKYEDSIARANFPMAADWYDHRLFIGCRNPSKLIIYDTRTGRELNDVGMTGDADDLYYDEKTGCVFVSGGAGAISIYKKQPGGGYSQTSRIPTRSGARTSLLVPELRIFLVAARATEGKPAQLLVYTLNY